MPPTRVRDQGKTAFIKEILVDDPRATAPAVNEAWTAAGMDGKISTTLVNKMRSQMGLTGNIRKGRKPADGATRGQAQKGDAKAARGARTGASPEADGATAPAEKSGRAGTRDRILKDVEGDIDRLIFKLMAVGGLEAVEDNLRGIRRQVVRSHGG